MFILTEKTRFQESRPTKTNIDTIITIIIRKQIYLSLKFFMAGNAVLVNLTYIY